MSDTDLSQATRWEMPDLTARRREPPKLEEIVAIEKAARDEGFARGHSEGHAAGMVEARRLASQIEGLLDNFARPLAQLDHEVEGLIGELATRIAGALVGQAYQTNPALLAALVEQALTVLGSERRNVEVRVSAADLAAIKPLLTLPDTVKLVADNALARGDLRCNTDSMRIDATLDSRLKNALANFHAEAAP